MSSINVVVIQQVTMYSDIVEVPNIILFMGTVCLKAALRPAGSGWGGGHEQRAGRGGARPLQRTPPRHLEEAGAGHPQVPGELDAAFQPPLRPVQLLGKKSRPVVHPEFLFKKVGEIQLAIRRGATHKQLDVYGKGYHVSEQRLSYIW